MPDNTSNTKQSDPNQADSSSPQLNQAPQEGVSSQVSSDGGAEGQRQPSWEGNQTSNMLPQDSARVDRKIRGQRVVLPADVDQPLQESLEKTPVRNLNEGSPPNVISEQGISGSMADLAADDDLLQASHQVGARLDEDEENPQPLDLLVMWPPPKSGDEAGVTSDYRGWFASSFDR